MDLTQALAKKMRSMKDKRGMGIGDIYPVILTIALVAILIAIILMVLSSLVSIGLDETKTFTNETIGITGIGISDVIDAAEECGYSSWNATRIINATIGSTVSNETLIEGTDYTINTNGTFTNLTELEGLSVWVSGTYHWKGATCESTESIIDQIADFVPWIGIMLLVIAAAIIIGILVRNLAGGSRV